MKSKCAVEGCNEKATLQVTEISGGKVVSAHVCGNHLNSVAAKESTEEAPSVARPDPAAMARLAELLVPVLCQGMLDANAKVRWRCVSLLPMLGAAAAPAISAVRNLTSDPDEEVRELAKQVLEWIEPTPTQEPGTHF